MLHHLEVSSNSTVYHLKNELFCQFTEGPYVMPLVPVHIQDDNNVQV